MKLHGTPPTRAIRVLWLLNELEVSHEMVEIDLPGAEGFAAMARA